jgi:flagellar basal-body rod protein FlgG
MSDTLHAIARSLGADVQGLSAISNNVANLHTPGYRAQRSVPRFDPSAPSGQAAPATVAATALDQGDGALAQASGEWDLALRGHGFFTVEREGLQRLVRSGAFRLDADRRLVTQSGDLVLGAVGPVQVPEGTVRVERDGRILVDGRPLDQLQVINVADPSRLQSIGDGAYAYDGPITAWEGEVIQGAIEQSNVDAADETVRLIELTRHAESVQRAIAMYDKAMDTGINQLANG